MLSLFILYSNTGHVTVWFICYLYVLDSEVQQRCHDIWIILPGKWRLGGCAIFKSFRSPIRSVTVDCTHVLESPHLFIPGQLGEGAVFVDFCLGLLLLIIAVRIHTINIATGWLFSMSVENVRPRMRCFSGTKSRNMQHMMRLHMPILLWVPHQMWNHLAP